MDAEDDGSRRVDSPDVGDVAEVSGRICFRFRQKRAPVSLRATYTFLFDLARSRTRALISHRWETGSRRRTASSMFSRGRGVAEASYATRCWFRRVSFAATEASTARDGVGVRADGWTGTQVRRGRPHASCAGERPWKDGMFLSSRRARERSSEGWPEGATLTAVDLNFFTPASAWPLDCG